MINKQNLRDSILKHMTNVTTNLERETENLELIKSSTNYDLNDVIELTKSIYRLEGQYLSYKQIFDDFNLEEFSE